MTVPAPDKADRPCRCPCCGYATLHERGGFEICPVCGWEDDGQDDHDADLHPGGPNGHLSLTEARENFRRYGASDQRRVANVRPPTAEERGEAHRVDRLRILHISTRLILGGSQENTVLSCEGQARLGHDVHLAFGPIYGPEGSLLERVQSFRTPDGRGITTHTIPHMVRQVSPLADWRARRELRRLIATLKPDIVHTHSSKAGILGRAAAYQRRDRQGASAPPPAIVHTIHGPPFMPVEGPPLRRLKTRLSNAVYTLAERFAARRCHAIVSVADAMTAQFLARGIGTPPLYTTVYSGMDTAAFLSPGLDRDSIRSSLGLAPGDLVIGTIARLAQHKGHDDLLDALAPDLKANPNRKLLWVGDGWWRDRLTAKARSVGLTIADASPSHPLTRSPAQLLLTGLVPPDRIPGLIRAMDILAHPSYREGLPRTVPQALLSGVCPVAYDVDGTGEVCRDMETGRLVPLADQRALGDAIRWLADHPSERADMAARGRDWCASRFSVDRMVADLETVYAKALSAARGKTATDDPGKPR